MADLDELNIPKAARPVAEEIIGITDEVCAKLLDAEYASLARQVVAKLARKRPSPLPGGRRVTWAAAVVYALGQVNFLFDSSGEPHRTADELSAAFGVAKTTMGSKAKLVRDMLKMSYFKPEFLRADVIAENPMVWFIEVDGLPMDARSLPLDLQTVAFRRGYIPYIPALGPEGTAALMELCTGRAPGPRMTARGTAPFMLPAISPLPVSVSKRRAVAHAEGPSVLTRSPAGQCGNRGRRLYWEANAAVLW